VGEELCVLDFNELDVNVVEPVDVLELLADDVIVGDTVFVLEGRLLSVPEPDRVFRALVVGVYVCTGVLEPLNDIVEHTVPERDTLPETVVVGLGAGFLVREGEELAVAVTVTVRVNTLDPVTDLVRMGLPVTLLAVAV
jgi:hypothetical protein